MLPSGFKNSTCLIAADVVP